MKLINLAKISFAGESGSAPVPPGPGPTPAPSADADVVLRDYDGSVVASYSAEDFAALTELPTPPEHEGLTFQEWNWPLADAQAYCAQYGMVDIGATYITSDGKTRIYITLTEGRTSPTLGLGINGSVDVDWGDDSAHDTMTGSSLSTLINQQHTYSQPGDYIITIDVPQGTAIALLGTSTDSRLLWNSIISKASYAYYNAVKSVEIGQGVTIGSGAFYNCYSLTSISIPQGVTSIINDAFRACSSLTSISIPQGVTSIGNYAFNSCLCMAIYRFYSTTPPTIQSGAFGSIPSDCIIYVPAESVEAYKAATNWSTYANQIHAMP